MPAAELLGKSGTGHTGNQGIVFANLASESVLIRVEQQRYLVTFRKAINHPESIAHQSFDRLDHHVPEAVIKWCFKVADFLGKAGKTVAVQTSDHIQFREQYLVQGLFIYAHFSVKIIKVHRSLSIR